MADFIEVIIDAVATIVKFLVNLIINLICLAVFCFSLMAFWRWPSLPGAYEYLRSRASDSHDAFRAWAFYCLGFALFDMVTLLPLTLCLCSWRCFHLLWTIYNQLTTTVQYRTRSDFDNEVYYFRPRATVWMMAGMLVLDFLCVPSFLLLHFAPWRLGIVYDELWTIWKQYGFEPLPCTLSYSVAPKQTNEYGFSNSESHLLVLFCLIQTIADLFTLAITLPFILVSCCSWRCLTFFHQFNYYKHEDLQRSSSWRINAAGRFYSLWVVLFVIPTDIVAVICVFLAHIPFWRAPLMYRALSVTYRNVGCDLFPATLLGKPQNLYVKTFPEQPPALGSETEESTKRQQQQKDQVCCGAFTYVNHFERYNDMQYKAIIIYYSFLRSWFYVLVDFLCLPFYFISVVALWRMPRFVTCWYHCLQESNKKEDERLSRLKPDEFDEECFSSFCWEIRILALTVACVEVPFDILCFPSFLLSVFSWRCLHFWHQASYDVAAFALDELARDRRKLDRKHYCLELRLHALRIAFVELPLDLLCGVLFVLSHIVFWRMPRMYSVLYQHLQLVGTCLYPTSTLTENNRKTNSVVHLFPPTPNPTCSTANKNQLRLIPTIDREPVIAEDQAASLLPCSLFVSPAIDCDCETCADSTNGTRWLICIEIFLKGWTQFVVDLITFTPLVLTFFSWRCATLCHRLKLALIVDAKEQDFSWLARGIIWHEFVKYVINIPHVLLFGLSIVLAPWRIGMVYDAMWTMYQIYGLPLVPSTQQPEIERKYAGKRQGGSSSPVVAITLATTTASTTTPTIAAVASDAAAAASVGAVRSGNENQQQNATTREETEVRERAKFEVELDLDERYQECIRDHCLSSMIEFVVLVVGVLPLCALAIVPWRLLFLLRGFGFFEPQRGEPTGDTVAAITTATSNNSAFINASVPSFSGSDKPPSSSSSSTTAVAAASVATAASAPPPPITLSPSEAARVRLRDKLRRVDFRDIDWSSYTVVWTTSLAAILDVFTFAAFIIAHFSLVRIPFLYATLWAEFSEKGSELIPWTLPSPPREWDPSETNFRFICFKQAGHALAEIVLLPFFLLLLVTYYRGARVIRYSVNMHQQKKERKQQLERERLQRIQQAQQQPHQQQQQQGASIGSGVEAVIPMPILTSTAPPPPPPAHRTRREVLTALKHKLFIVAETLRLFRDMFTAIFALIVLFTGLRTVTYINDIRDILRGGETSEDESSERNKAARETAVADDENGDSNFDVEIVDFDDKNWQWIGLTFTHCLVLLRDFLLLPVALIVLASLYRGYFLVAEVKRRVTRWATIKKSAITVNRIFLEPPPDGRRTGVVLRVEGTKDPNFVIPHDHAEAISIYVRGDESFWDNVALSHGSVVATMGQNMLPFVVKREFFNPSEQIRKGDTSVSLVFDFALDAKTTTFVKNLDRIPSDTNIIIQVEYGSSHEGTLFGAKFQTRECWRALTASPSIRPPIPSSSSLIAGSTTLTTRILNPFDSAAAIAGDSAGAEVAHHPANATNNNNTNSDTCSPAPAFDSASSQHRPTSVHEVGIDRRFNLQTYFQKNEWRGEKFTDVWWRVALLEFGMLLLDLVTLAFFLLLHAFPHRIIPLYARACESKERRINRTFGSVVEEVQELVVNRFPESVDALIEKCSSTLKVSPKYWTSNLHQDVHIWFVEWKETLCQHFDPALAERGLHDLIAPQLRTVLKEHLEFAEQLADAMDSELKIKFASTELINETTQASRKQDAWSVKSFVDAVTSRVYRVMGQQGVSASKILDPTAKVSELYRLAAQMQPSQQAASGGGVGVGAGVGAGAATSSLSSSSSTLSAAKIDRVEVKTTTCFELDPRHPRDISAKARFLQERSTKLLENQIRPQLAAAGRCCDLQGSEGVSAFRWNLASLWLELLKDIPPLICFCFVAATVYRFPWMIWKLCKHTHSPRRVCYRALCEIFADVAYFILFCFSCIGIRAIVAVPYDLVRNLWFYPSFALARLIVVHHWSLVGRDVYRIFRLVFSCRVVQLVLASTVFGALSPGVLIEGAIVQGEAGSANVCSAALVLLVGLFWMFGLPFVLAKKSFESDAARPGTVFFAVMLAFYVLSIIVTFVRRPEHVISLRRPIVKTARPNWHNLSNFFWIFLELVQLLALSIGVLAQRGGTVFGASTLTTQSVLDATQYVFLLFLRPSSNSTSLFEKNVTMDNPNATSKLVNVTDVDYQPARVPVGAPITLAILVIYFTLSTIPIVTGYVLKWSEGRSMRRSTLYGTAMKIFGFALQLTVARNVAEVLACNSTSGGEMKIQPGLVCFSSPEHGGYAMAMMVFAVYYLVSTLAHNVIFDDADAARSDIVVAEFYRMLVNGPLVAAAVCVALLGNPSSPSTSSSSSSSVPAPLIIILVASLWGLFWSFFYGTLINSSSGERAFCTLRLVELLRIALYFSSSVCAIVCIVASAKYSNSSSSSDSSSNSDSLWAIWVSIGVSFVAFLVAYLFADFCTPAYADENSLDEVRQELLDLEDQYVNDDKMTPAWVQMRRAWRSRVETAVRVSTLAAAAVHLESGINSLHMQNMYLHSRSTWSAEAMRMIDETDKDGDVAQNNIKWQLRRMAGDDFSSDSGDSDFGGGRHRGDASSCCSSCDCCCCCKGCCENTVCFCMRYHRTCRVAECCLYGCYLCMHNRDRWLESDQSSDDDVKEALSQKHITLLSNVVQTLRNGVISGGSGDDDDARNDNRAKIEALFGGGQGAGAYDTEIDDDADGDQQQYQQHSATRGDVIPPRPREIDQRKNNSNNNNKQTPNPFHQPQWAARDRQFSRATAPDFNDDDDDQNDNNTWTTQNNKDDVDVEVIFHMRKVLLGIYRNEKYNKFHKHQASKDEKEVMSLVDQFASEYLEGFPNLTTILELRFGPEAAEEFFKKFTDVIAVKPTTAPAAAANVTTSVTVKSETHVDDDDRHREDDADGGLKEEFSL